MEARNLLIGLSIKHNGDWEKIYKAVSSKDVEELESFIEQFEKSGCKALTMLDKEYPDSLKHSYQPPFVLFYEGDLSLLDHIDSNLAVVGTHEPTGYGIEMTHNLVGELSRSYNIVTSIRPGIDSIACDAALSNEYGHVIAVVAGGFGCKTKYKNWDELKKNHLVLTEYFGTEKPEVHKGCMGKDRIIVGLSKGLLVIEDTKTGRSAVTANLALSNGREILAVPGRAGEDSLSNSLIRTGAVLVETAEDVKTELEAFVMSSTPEEVK
jgi:Predicted Rossmann fold nucleotide-binding protein involved in DNA uptake